MIIFGCYCYFTATPSRIDFVQDSSAGLTGRILATTCSPHIMVRVREAVTKQVRLAWVHLLVHAQLRVPHAACIMRVVYIIHLW